MKKILIHTIFPNAQNGPNSVNKLIRESVLLNESYQIEDVFQTELPGKNPFKFIKLVLRMRRDIASKKADAIIVTGLQFAGFCCTLAAKLARVKKIIVCVHGYSGDAVGVSGLMRWIYNTIIEPLTIKMSSAVYTVCVFAANRKMMKKYGRKRLYGTIHNCFNDSNIAITPGFRKNSGIPDDSIVLTSVGRVVEDKGHREIIDALKQGLPSNCTFVVVGDGPYLDCYKQECGDLINNKKLLLLGKRNDVLDILSESDIFVFPTYHENLSMALLEACYSKCAIIATDVGGNAEVVRNGYNGMLIQPRKAQELYNAMLYMIDETKVRLTYGGNAFAFQQKHFSYAVFEKNMKKMIELITNGKDSYEKKS